MRAPALEAASPFVVSKPPRKTMQAMAVPAPSKKKAVYFVKTRSIVVDDDNIMDLVRVLPALICSCRKDTCQRITTNSAFLAFSNAACCQKFFQKQIRERGGLLTTNRAANYYTHGDPPLWMYHCPRCCHLPCWPPAPPPRPTPPAPS